MPIEKIEIDQAKVNSLVDFFHSVVDTVTKAANETARLHAEKVKDMFHTALDQGDVPGPELEASTIALKRSRGLHLSKLQRFGRGDSRSYYENIVTRKLPSGNGWFVGVLEGTNVYTIDGEINSHLDMVELARKLEFDGIENGKTWPLWTQTFERSARFLPETLYNELVRELKMLGAGDAG